METYTMFIVFIIALITLYVLLSYPLRTRPDFQIIQTNVESFKPTMLLEKYPIVIDDRIVDPASMVRTIFKYQYMWLKDDGAIAPAPACPKAKYTVLYNGDSENKIDVNIIHPKYRALGDQAPFTKVILHPHQTLVMPPLWSYLPSAAVNRIELWDVSHWIVSVL